MRPRAMQEFDLLGPLANVARRSHALHLVAVRLYIVQSCILVFCVSLCLVALVHGYNMYFLLAEGTHVPVLYFEVLD